MLGHGGHCDYEPAAIQLSMPYLENVSIEAEGARKDGHVVRNCIAERY